MKFGRNCQFPATIIRLSDNPSHLSKLGPKLILYFLDEDWEKIAGARYYKRLADGIDNYSRVVFPVSYHKQSFPCLYHSFLTHFSTYLTTRFKKAAASNSLVLALSDIMLTWLNYSISTIDPPHAFLDNYCDFRESLVDMIIKTCSSCHFFRWRLSTGCTTW